ncbi:hypothetical protein IC229_16775 [Spirosoma sp. BT702]|uniref:Uncharacterized protein n=1 Tax=Spirosoma profusum TaxID=2771354 RepID=A0A926Y3X6_9BACT|nr:hypothetical protein [Spirosoma profusum]MBD2702306.1 hypothetical protein [Spirosoma profusum]
MKTQENQIIANQIYAQLAELSILIKQATAAGLSVTIREIPSVDDVVKSTYCKTVGNLSASITKTIVEHY